MVFRGFGTAGIPARVWRPDNSAAGREPHRYRAPNRSASLVRRSLKPIQLGVRTATPHQFLVRAGFNDSRAVEHHDDVSHPHGGEAVRDEDRDTAPRRNVVLRGDREALEQRVLGLGIERGGGLVENEQQRPDPHEPARERELLPLTEGHVDASGPRRSKLGRQARSKAGNHV